MARKSNSSLVLHVVGNGADFPHASKFAETVKFYGSAEEARKVADDTKPVKKEDQKTEPKFLKVAGAVNGKDFVAYSWTQAHLMDQAVLQRLHGQKAVNGLSEEELKAQAKAAAEKAAAEKAAHEKEIADLKAKSAAIQAGFQQQYDSASKSAKVTIANMARTMGYPVNES